MVKRSELVPGGQRLRSHRRAHTLEDTLNALLSGGTLEYPFSFMSLLAVRFRLRASASDSGFSTPRRLVWDSSVSRMEAAPPLAGSKV